KQAELSQNNNLADIDISDIDIDFIKQIKITDVYEYFDYLSTERKKFHNSQIFLERGLSPAARARKVSSLRSFFKYLQKTGRISENIMQELEFPKTHSKLPHYLTYDESIKLLESIDGDFKIRDFCIIMIFLNCGLRVSELTGININDVKEETLRVLGKGGKERVVYLNDATHHAIELYLQELKKIKKISQKDEKAMFISRQGNRISPSTVKWLVKKYCSHAGLDSKISVHKLRHTSATLMYKNGVDVKAVQEVLGHEHLNTTEIYTHADSEILRVAAQANPLSNFTTKKGNK
ncbi:MAG: tyrosine-type recombinase/integrase, partial [Oscillospiraceae bacterium]|nr:tyrosine-type recombinase/integrase [Oscillospiraceae bacterium]